MLDPNQKHFELLSDDYSESQTVNLSQLLIEQSKNSVPEMFVFLVANLLERRLLSKDDLAEMIGVGHTQLSEWRF